MLLEQNVPSDILLVKDRHPFLVNFCTKKNKVLHIGCVDSGLLMERYNSGELLHQKLDEVCDDLWGIDIDVEGIEFLKSKGFGNLFALDIGDEKFLSAIAGIQFDVIVLSEVIEHLLNVGLFLESVKKIMSPKTQLVISVPNAFSLTGLFYMVDNIEYVHPDHNYYFSYATLKNVVTKCGLKISEHYFYAFKLPKNCNHVDYIVRQNNDNVQGSKGYLRSLKEYYWLYLDCKKRNVGFVKNLIFYEFLAKYLFRKSSSWADGIIFICTL